MNLFKRFLIFLFTMFFVSSVQAAQITGGDASDMSSADVILDMAFAIDTSGSMRNEASGISAAMGNLVNDPDCPDCNVFVRASFYGTPRQQAVYSLFSSMSEPTGGTTIYFGNDSIESDLADIICAAASGGGGNNNPVIPESGSIFLLGLGLLVFSFFLKKKIR
ncbi:MAG: hypothetical protein CSA18_04200 [Deltaproteobacteria bacterium]|nr:MAG: hypothetical protein CSA18_04200 [Deltaproteobacteria bacterium]